MILKILKIAIKIVLLICISVLILLILQFVVNSKYRFPEPHAFKGDYIYNPYRNIDKTKWRTANFHVHTRLYFGLTNGALNSVKYLDSLYNYFGYDIYNISNYQNINTYESKNKWFVPVYEHGYQYYKNHQLVLNAKKVNWIDYFFRQTLDNKQFILNQLKKDTSAVLTIVHPSFRKAYSFNDLKYLSNYNCMEISNEDRIFISCYDTVLSAGHPVFIMADDDAHDLRNIDEGCHSLNLINTDIVRDSILHALKTGRSIGVKLNISSCKTNEEKKAVLLRLPEIEFITLTNDTLNVSLNHPVKTIKFIGQNGTERRRIDNCSTGSYFFKKNDTYIRTEIECSDGTFFYLNPFFKYDGNRLTYYSAPFNVLKTWAWRSAVLSVLILTFILIRTIKKTKG